MPARGKDIRQIKYMPFLTADIGREELSSEQNTHQVILYPPARWPRKDACRAVKIAY
jgi:hypothetical protein